MFNAQKEQKTNNKRKLFLSTESIKFFSEDDKQNHSRRKDILFGSPRLRSSPIISVCDN